MHYNTAGTEQTNRMTMAFKFYPAGLVPKYQVRSYAVRNIPNDEIEIPPNSIARTDGYFRLPRNGADRLIPASHAHAREGDDAGGDQP